MRILTIGAHPDDAENFVGGTLALCAERGDDITIAVATRGDIGAPSGTRDQIALTRRHEAQSACDILGAKLIWMGWDDEFLFNTRETRVATIDVIREARPDVVFMLNEDDYHPDHRTIGTLTRDARIPASVPLITTRYPHTPIPTVFICDIYSDGAEVAFSPDIYVDTTSVQDTKTRMLDAHASQAAWMQAVFSADMERDSSKRDRYRGSQIGTEFAEAFRLLGDYPSTGGAELLPHAIVRSRRPG